APACHRVIPSFPTRRSSELEQRLDAAVLERRAAEHRHERRAVATDRLDGPPADGRLDFLFRDLLARQVLLEDRVVDLADLFNERSEEHTSELQSRENLVCRL